MLIRCASFLPHLKKLVLDVPLLAVERVVETEIFPSAPQERLSSPVPLKDEPYSRHV